MFESFIQKIDENYLKCYFGCTLLINIINYIQDKRNQRIFFALLKDKVGQKNKCFFRFSIYTESKRMKSVINLGVEFRLY